MDTLNSFASDVTFSLSFSLASEVEVFGATQGVSASQILVFCLVITALLNTTVRAALSLTGKTATETEVLDFFIAFAELVQRVLIAVSVQLIALLVRREVQDSLQLILFLSGTLFFFVFLSEISVRSAHYRAHQKAN